MVKIYYGYQFQKPIDQIISKNCNFVYERSRRIFITGANQYISIISAKTGEVLCYLKKQNKNIPVRIVYYSDGKIFAGYEDGEIVVWELTNQHLQTSKIQHITSSQQEDPNKQLFSFDLHKSTVTSICVANKDNKLISAGMDGNIIIWDLLSQQSYKIKSAHPSAITQIQLLQIMYNGKPITAILSIGKDGFFRVWNTENQLCLASICLQVTQAYSMYVDKITKIVYIGTNKEDIVSIQFFEDGNIQSRICQIRGVFKKKSYARCIQISVEQDIMYIASADKMLETYQILNKLEVEQRKKKIISRKKKQQKQDTNDPEIPPDVQLQLKEINQKTLPFKFYSLCVTSNPDPTVYINSGTNIYDMNNQKQITSGSGRTLQLQYSHPYAIQRTKNGVQMYNANLLKMNKLYGITGNTIAQQIQSSNKLKQDAPEQNKLQRNKISKNNEVIKYCWLFNSAFLMIVMGGSVCIWDLAKNECVFVLEGQFDGCFVKKNKCILWAQNNVHLYGIGYNKKKSIVMRLQSSKSYEEKIIWATYKNNSFQKYLVSLQNNQIYIQYSDSHKNFLKLYGHKLPILSFSVSEDDALIATGSADKDLKLWDMDFGHCIKSIFAHQEAITVVKFIRDTHYLLSGSKDGHIKYWDADTYQLIIDLDENLLEVRDLIIGDAGQFILTGGLDEGMRLWKQTNEQTIAADMEEKQMEKIMIEDYTKDKLSKEDHQAKVRYEDLKNGEQIIEALENSQNPKTILNLLKKISPSNLKSSLSFLHSRHIKRLEQYIELCIQNNYEQQLCWRVMKELNKGSELGNFMRDSMKSIKNMIGVNSEALKVLLVAIKDQNSLGLN